MGVVHAKEPAGPTSTNGGNEIDFFNIPVKVDRVIIDGVRRTKDDFVIKQVQSIFEATNFQEMITMSHEVKVRMEKLGIFKSVGIYVDTSKGPKSNKDGYEVFFDVIEKRTMFGGINTLIGNNDASLLFSLRFPNLFGRAERVQTEYTHGTKSSRGVHFAFVKPLNGDPDRLFSFGINQHHAEYPWSGYKETDRGVFADFTFPSIFGSHCVRWEGVWRDLRALSRMTAFAVREQAGHSLKSSLKHMFVRDRRDDTILPTEGTLLRIVQEYAGVGGNVEFMKQDVEFQVNKPLIFDTVIQLSMAAGIMKSLDANKEIKINDKFFLGGPLTLRGFNLKGVGPQSDGNALGADTYWLGALHLYTPLPFRPGKGGFGELFRTHLFVNAGNLGNINFSGDIADSLWKLGGTFRWAYGGGIVLRMGRIARLELNYVVPMRIQQGDSANPGLQFGIGLTFL